MKVYGPYTRKDGRKHVVISDDMGLHTISYPKWLMEQHLGRKLAPDETVDHLDRDFTNDKIENLVVKKRVFHCKEDATRVKLVSLKCIRCQVDLPPQRPGDIRRRSKDGRAGPFCRRCAGVYGTEVQNKREAKLAPRQDTDFEYYKLDKA